MSNNTTNIEAGTIYVSCWVDVDHGVDESVFTPDIPRFIYEPEQDSERPWRIINPDPLFALFFGAGVAQRFRHEGDIEERLKEGTLRHMTEDEAAQAAVYDAANGY